MYRAYMSYAQLKEYLALLQEKGLIEFDDRTQLYRLTEKGLRFMNAYDKIYELVPKASERNAPPEKGPVSEVYEY
jgi:predicted transcriptional regulator